MSHLFSINKHLTSHAIKYLINIVADISLLLSIGIGFCYLARFY